MEVYDTAHRHSQRAGKEILVMSRPEMYDVRTSKAAGRIRSPRAVEDTTHFSLLWLVIVDLQQ